MMTHVIETYSWGINDDGERELVKTSSKPCYSYTEAIALFDIALKTSIDVRVEMKGLRADRSGYFSIKSESPSKWRYANGVKLSPDLLKKSGQQVLC